jgi:plastocyanin
MRVKSIVLPTVAAVIVLLVALAFSKSIPKQSTAASHSSAVVATKATTVKIYMYSYIPDKLTVKAGTRITFKNMDMTAHTATALNESFDTGTIQPGQSKTIVVKKAGTYPYHCLFHEFMTGTLTVDS